MPSSTQSHHEQLNRSESELYTSKTLYSLGVLYLEYHRDYYYWEILKIIEKVAVISVLNICNGNTILKGILVFSFIFCYSLLTLFRKSTYLPNIYIFSILFNLSLARVNTKFN